MLVYIIFKHLYNKIDIRELSTDKKLTEFCMSVSTSALTKVWDSDEDEYWNTVVIESKH